MIVTLQYYAYTYFGEPVSAAEFPRLEAAARRAVALMTHGRAEEANFSALPESQQAAVKNAICAQVGYYALMGSAVAVTGDLGGNGFTVGKVHVNGTNGAWVGRNIGSMMLCPAAIAALEQSGLLYPGVPTVDAPGPLLPGGWSPC